MHPFEHYKPLIDDWDAFTQCLEKPLPRTLWLNPLKSLSPMTQAALMDQWQSTCWPNAFQTETALTERSDWGSHWGYHAGLYHLQEIVSILPVTLLNPQAGERILDLCAAPGSKTVQMALAMQNQGTLIANDKNYNRTKALRYHLERLGIVNVTTTTFDGTSYPNAAGLFDKILVDAPCSGEGTSRKKIREWAHVENTQRIHLVQERLLSRAANLCKPGGLIVYSTCTYAPEENESVVNTILKKHPDLSLLPIHLPDLKTSPGITQWKEEYFSDELKKTVRIWPHYNNTGGFYLALLHKKETSIEKTEIPFIPSEPGVFEELQHHLSGYNIPESELKKFVYFRVPKHGIYALSNDHASLSTPKPDAIGLFVFKTRMQHPKLTTAGARLWGHLAQQQYIELDDDQVMRYLKREELILSDEEIKQCKNSGYVIVRYQGLGLGTGLLLHTPIEGEWLLKSLYPKR